MICWFIIIFMGTELVEQTAARFLFGDDSPHDDCADPPTKMSNCPEGAKPLWYYNPTTKTCALTAFPVCDDSINAFPREDVCREACNPPWEYADNEDLTMDRCNVEKHSGELCSEESKKPDELWYFNKDTVSCTPFTHLGCGDIKNFETKDECEEDCLPGKTIHDLISITALDT
ncbi:carboxypeptidase inhibitor SmCI-like [Dermacentor silvarum]|uniref:carboxypeptidase inhibitor SmCI-like n=1 Tax=Dermacentor silvarum TaxID=543639 RepID=UPI0021015FD5|nr:carboxypeptidase inhibitor SmCI-like [Dermacentor silvarum]